MGELPVEIDVHATKRLLDEGQIVLIDCREPVEYELARIDGSVLMPMSRWGEIAHRLSEYRDEQIVVYCHHGNRSLHVTYWLRENGFPTAQNMLGGIEAWSEAIDPRVPKY